MGGIYIDGKLEAFSLGVYGKAERMAVIHVEKANPEIRGLYPFICQQFLLHEFPDALLVNREDDIGLEGSESRSSPTIRFIWKKNTKSDKNKAVSR